jgi:hypothetical protein
MVRLFEVWAELELCGTERVILYDDMEKLMTTGSSNHQKMSYWFHEIFPQYYRSN